MNQITSKDPFPPQPFCDSVNYQAQRVLITGIKSGYTQGLILNLILLNHFINDLDDGIECILHKITYDIKPGAEADTQNHCFAIQRDVNRLEKKAQKSP